ncbi:MAG: polyhydroxyalkanoate synthesis repressor PhaR [Alphaproteobacteria bacterium]
MAAKQKKAPVTIKKYANRRLYNTATSSYVTLDNLAGMVKDGVDFIVVDAKTGEDITRQVLTQIIFEEENKGPNLLPVSFLRQLIGFYGDSLEALVPNYLDYTMRAFAKNQEQMRRHISETMGGIFPFAQWEEIGRQNVAMFERAVQMWSPFHASADGASDGAKESGEATEGDEGSAENTLDILRSQLDALRKQVDDLAQAKKDE